MELVTHYDRRICADEMEELFSPPYIIPGLAPLGGIKFECWEWREAEQKLRQSFKFLGLL
jgi:hypothetical protein